MRVRSGDRFTKRRTFTREDVDAFVRLVGDAGQHHVRPDGQGRVMVHGLFTASIPTQIGGELDYVAREMTFEYVRPVWTGDTVEADLVITESDESMPQRVAMAVTCRNQHGQDVLRGTSRGIISAARP